MFVCVYIFGAVAYLNIPRGGPEHCPALLSARRLHTRGTPRVLTPANLSSGPSLRSAADALADGSDAHADTRAYALADAFAHEQNTRTDHFRADRCAVGCVRR
jgi:hypothetical protein